MITIEEARRVAAEFALRDGFRLGGQWRPVVAEFEQGYAIWTAPPAGSRPQPGASCTVIDRDTGIMSTWPSAPAADIAAAYATGRAGAVEAPRTADPAVALRRIGRRLPAPGVIAYLTLDDGFVRQATGAKGDQVLNHHPLVAGWLASLAPGLAVRGADRHAELIVLSDILHQHDLATGASTDLTAARRLLRDAGGLAEVYQVRDAGHPQHAARCRPCDTCLRAWVHFGLMPARTVDLLCEPVEPSTGRPAPDPARFPADVAGVLVAGGWGAARRLPDGQPFDPEKWGRYAVLNRCDVPGQRHVLTQVAAASAAIGRYPLILAGRRGPGISTWVRPFELVCDRTVDHHADTLGDFAQVLGVRLFPIGQEEDGESLIAVDEHGRVFVLDQAGEWYYGQDLDTALVALVQGWQPLRVRDDGSLEPAL